MNTLTTYIKQVMRNPSAISPIVLFHTIVFIGGVLAALFGAQLDIEDTTHTQTPAATHATTTATTATAAPTPRLSTVAQQPRAESETESEVESETSVEVRTNNPEARDDEAEYNVVVTHIVTADEPSKPSDSSRGGAHETTLHTLEAAPDPIDVELNDVTSTTTSNNTPPAPTTANTHAHIDIDTTIIPGEVRINGDEVVLETPSVTTENSHVEESHTEESHTEEETEEAEVVINEVEVGETSALAPTSTTPVTLHTEAPAPHTAAIATSTITVEDVTASPTHVSAPTTPVAPSDDNPDNPDTPATDDEPQYPSPWSTDSIYAKNAPYVTMHQGDKIQTLTSSCTLSYVDKETRTGYTAAHCIGDRRTTDIAQRRTAIPLWGVHEGRPTYIGEAIMATNVTDLAIVKFADNVVIGDNLYSGNTMFTGELSADDYICRYGAESRIGACTPYYSTNNDTVYSQEEHLIPGDSGGPSWVSDAQGNPKGYLGVYAGSIYISGGHFAVPTAFDRTILLNAGIFNT